MLLIQVSIKIVRQYQVNLAYLDETAGTILPLVEHSECGDLLGIVSIQSSGTDSSVSCHDMQNLLF